MTTAIASAEQIKQFAARDPARAYERLGYLDKLRRQGNNFVGACPFHAERNGSFAITIDGDHAGLFKCFGCDAAGDVISFYQKVMHETDFVRALDEIGHLFGLVGDTSSTSRPRPIAVPKPDPEPELPPLTAETVQGCHERLLQSETLLAWLTEQKGLPATIILDAQLGIGERPHWGTKPRLTIPIPYMDGRDGFADIRGYGPGREPKMLPWEKGRGSATVYPWIWMREEAVLLWCEGEIDSLNLIGRGIPAVTATCGAKAAIGATFTLPDLTGKTIHVIGDHDEAGEALNVGLPPKLRGAGADEVHVIRWPDDAEKGFDVSDFFAQGGTVEGLVPWM